MRSVHEGDTYDCDVCDDKATIKGNLKQHVKSVREGVKYNCERCDYRAIQKWNLRVHQKSVHEVLRTLSNFGTLSNHIAFDFSFQKPSTSGLICFVDVNLNCSICHELLLILAFFISMFSF